MSCLQQLMKDLCQWSTFPYSTTQATGRNPATKRLDFKHTSCWARPYLNSLQIDGCFDNECKMTICGNFKLGRNNPPVFSFRCILDYGPVHLASYLVEAWLSDPALGEINYCDAWRQIVCANEFIIIPRKISALPNVQSQNGKPTDCITRKSGGINSPHKHSMDKH